MDPYHEDFKRALSWTKKQGLAVPETYFEAGRLMSEARLQKLTFAVKRVFKTLSLDEIQAQSLRLHQDLQSIVEEVFESSVFYTLGFVHWPPTDYFKLTQDEISDLIIKGAQEPHPTLHAWLTLPSLEILDFSINTTLAEALRRPEIAGKMLAAHPSLFKGGLRFHPLLVGDAFLKKEGGF